MGNEGIFKGVAGRMKVCSRESLLKSLMTSDLYEAQWKVCVPPTLVYSKTANVLIT